MKNISLKDIVLSAHGVTAISVSLAVIASIATPAGLELLLPAQANRPMKTQTLEPQKVLQPQRRTPAPMVPKKAPVPALRKSQPPPPPKKAEPVKKAGTVKAPAILPKAPAQKNTDGQEPQRYKPPASVCGDWYCDTDTGETTATCPSDCPKLIETGCGNGKVEAGEQCDAGPKNGKNGSCTSVCEWNLDALCPVCARFGDGNMSIDPCNSTYSMWCQVVGTGTQQKCVPRQPLCDGHPPEHVPVCGDYHIDPGEECDAGPYDKDQYYCTDKCKRPLPVCGNYKLEPGEYCDAGPKGSPVCTDKCKPVACPFGCVEY